MLTWLVMYIVSASVQGIGFFRLGQDLVVRTHGLMGRGIGTWAWLDSLQIIDPFNVVRFHLNFINCSKFCDIFKMKREQ